MYLEVRDAIVMFGLRDQNVGTYRGPFSRPHLQKSLRFVGRLAVPYFGAEVEGEAVAVPPCWPSA